jgi:hypothetical protein
MLLSVSALSAGDVWAVGQTYELDGSILTLTEQYNGTTWSIQPSLDPGTLGPLVDSSLVGVTSGGAGDVLAVGTQHELGPCCTATLSLVTGSG